MQPQPAQAGELLELHIRIVQARGLPLSPRQESYALVRVGAREARSGEVAGGAAPVYNWKHVFEGVEPTAVVAVNLVQAGGMLSGASLAGAARLSAATLADGAVIDVWLPLTRGEGAREADAGEVNVRAQLMRQGQRPLAPPPAMAAAELARVGRAALAAGLAGSAAAPPPQATAPAASAPPMAAPAYAPQPAYAAAPPPPPPGYVYAPAPAAGPPQGYAPPPPQAYPPPYPGAPPPAMYPPAGGFPQQAYPGYAQPAYAPQYAPQAPMPYYPGQAPQPYYPTPYGQQPMAPQPYYGAPPQPYYGQAYARY